MILKFNILKGIQVKNKADAYIERLTTMLSTYLYNGQTFSFTTSDIELYFSKNFANKYENYFTFGISNASIKLESHCELIYGNQCNKTTLLQKVTIMSNFTHVRVYKINVKIVIQNKNLNT